MNRIQYLLKHAPGKTVEIWVPTWGGLSWLGRFYVDKGRRTLIGPQEWTQPMTWTELRKLYRRENKRELRIGRARVV